MLRKSVLRAIPVALTSLVLAAGCDAEPKAEKVIVEEDIVMKDGSVVSDWVVADIVPVPARKAPAVAGARPSNEHIWIPGEWKRTGDKWEWEAGHWLKPPHRNAEWIHGHWSHIADKWHWTPGHWVVTGKRLYVTEPLVAPMLLPETQPEKPSDHNHWVAGYWDWDDHWYWVPGYWTTKPHPDAEWVVGHWDEFGMDGGYRWIGGHWRIKG